MKIPGHFQHKGQINTNFQDTPGHSKKNCQIPGFLGFPGRVATMNIQLEGLRALGSNDRVAERWMCSISILYYFMQTPVCDINSNLIIYIVPRRVKTQLQFSTLVWRSWGPWNPGTLDPGPQVLIIQAKR